MGRSRGLVRRVSRVTAPAAVRDNRGTSLTPCVPCRQRIVRGRPHDEDSAPILCATCRAPCSATPTRGTEHHDQNRNISGRLYPELVAVDRRVLGFPTCRLGGHCGGRPRR